MRFITGGSIFQSIDTYVANGKKQELRRARRSGETTARQQIKQAKAARRIAKISA